MFKGHSKTESRCRVVRMIADLGTSSRVRSGICAGFGRVICTCGGTAAILA